MATNDNTLILARMHGVLAQPGTPETDADPRNPNAPHKIMFAREDGWCDWAEPIMDGYSMSCCDCGLVHDMQFAVLRKGRDLPDGTWTATELDPNKYRVRLRARRNPKATASARRKRK